MRKTRRFLALTAGLALVGAACGSSDGGSSSGTTAAATTVAVTTTAGSSDTTAGATTTAGSDGATTTAASSGDKQVNADKVAAIEAAAKTTPLKATGDPIVIGFQNPEGDPAGTFPEYTLATEAAVKYINEELGGVGGDPATGKAGRPIKLEVCKMVQTPADSQRCANEIASKKPFAVISSLNFFGNQFAIYRAANIPVIVGTPLTALDFTTPGAYAVGGGGGCLGVHTGLVWFVTQELGKKRIGVPWADTPPGVFCYHDLEKKPLEVLAGKKLAGGEIKAEGNTLKGTIPTLEHIGVSMKPGQADLTPQATQVLDFKPDGMILSAQGSDCWTLVNAMSKLGWKADAIPFVLSTSCLDIAKMKEIGDITKGIYFVGGASIQAPESLTGQLKDEALTYQAKMKQYAEGGSDTAGKGFASAGFTTMMQVWEVLSESTGGDPTKADQANFVKLMSETKNHHQWGGTGLSCADGAANAPYVSVCNATVTASRWDGEKLNPIKQGFTGLSLVKGTELDFGK